MAADTTVTYYKAREKKSHKGEYVKPDKEKMEETVRRWKLRKAQRKFNLKKFLGEGVKKEDNGNKTTEHTATE